MNGRGGIQRGRSRAAVLSALALLSLDCGERVDGTPLEPAMLGLQACAADLDCGPGRHCSGNTCAVDCNTSKDCGYALSSPNAPNNLECSPCGRCVAAGTRDSRCLSAVDQPCASDAECQQTLGAQYQCNAHGTCAHLCKSEDDCKSSGRGFGCGDKGSCVRKCFRDADCVFFGYQYACALPAGVDPVANAEAFSPVYGECLPGADLGFKPPGPSDPPAAKYQGIWGLLLASSVQVSGVPILSTINSVSVQRLLVKMNFTTQGDLILTNKWCSVDIHNFSNNDGPPPSLFQFVVPDLNVDSILMTKTRATNVPALATDATFTTDPFVDLRGAKLADPALDPLPTYKDLTHQWDQDRDGHPGMTASVTGVLQGQLYQAQRTIVAFQMSVFDADHLGGLVKAKSDATSLGATEATLVNDAVTTQHPSSDRTYFRAQRLADDASCADVMRIGATPGSWLEFQPHYDPTTKP